MLRILLSLAAVLAVCSFSHGQWIYPNDTNTEIGDMWFEVPNTGRVQESMWDHPCLTEGESPEPTNSFFGITTKGEVWIGTVDSNTPGAVIDDPGQLQHVKYAFPMTNFMYLKLINSYEDEEDPDALVVSGPVNVSSNFPIPVVGLAQEDLPNQYFYTSNDLVDNQDVVLTILPNYMSQGSVPYLLCYDGAELVQFEPAPFSFGSAVAINTTVSLVEFDQMLPDGQVCALFTPSDDSKPVFINQKVTLMDDVSSGEIQFTLMFPELSEGEIVVGGEAIPAEEVPAVCIAGAYNDPNFTRLECVWIDGAGIKYGRYHVECFNDGQAPFEPLIMSVALPPGAMSDKVVVDEVMAKCLSRCSRLSPEAEKYIKSRINYDRLSHDKILELRFDQGLCGYNHSSREKGRPDTCLFTAWFEFTVQFTAETDLAFDDLQPGQPMTTFVETDYDIHPYYDDKVCYSSGMLDTLAQMEPNRQLVKEYLQRISSRSKLCQLGRVVGDADCADKCSDNEEEQSCKKVTSTPPEDKWGATGLVVAVAIALLLLLLLRRRQSI